ncbi:proliferation-associated protein 2G4 [Agrilus planipennis]|uniref:Proliferation-associated protein 2G4 n=1 Tax=Agrilus planipennis TaxID=224129 RepID=A0A1W4WM77_AGRPL|nr:proliferation-associated protein 2G4 [Agrilus planipennis]
MCLFQIVIEAIRPCVSGGSSTKMADEKDVPEKTIAEDLVVTKYKMAGEIVNRVLKQVLDKCVAGASVREICEYGDQLLTEETSKVFKKEKELKKGIAFPTCVSVNNCVCHFSPVPSEPDYILKDEDIAKVDLGAHIDGFIAVVAHTIVIGASPEKKVTGRKADVILAAHYASQAALRLLKPGIETYAVTDAVQKVAESYKCKPVEGMLSHQLKQFKIDGEKTIIQNPNEAQRKEHEKFEFDKYEVYAMDVLISTGDGVGEFLISTFNIFAFISNEICRWKKRLQVLKKNFTCKINFVCHFTSEYVAHFKFTVLLMPNGPHRITGLPFESDLYESQYSVVDPELKTLLSSSANPKAAKKKKKKSESMSEQPMEVEAAA